MQNLPLYLYSLFLVWLISSCSEVKKTSTRGEKEENSGDACANCQTPGSSIKTPEDGTEKFCEDAKDIKQASIYSSYYDQYCKDGKPTAQFRNLISDAFSGSGKPKIVEFAPFTQSQSDGTTSWWIAGGFTVPVSAKDLVAKMRLISALDLPKLGFNPLQAAKFLIEHVANFPKEDKYHIGGEEISISADGFKNFPLTLGFNQRGDLYQFDDTTYLYATHVKMPTKMVQKLDVYVAILDVNGKAYIIPQVSLSVANLDPYKGFSADLLRSLIEGSFTSTYQFFVNFLKSK